MSLVLNPFTIKVRLMLLNSLLLANLVDPFAYLQLEVSWFQELTHLLGTMYLVQWLQSTRMPNFQMSVPVTHLFLVLDG